MIMYGLMEIIDHKEVFIIIEKVGKARILIEALEFIKKFYRKTIAIDTTSGNLWNCDTVKTIPRK